MQNETVLRYQALARYVGRIYGVAGDPKFAKALDASRERLGKLMETAPSGSGFDNGTTVELGRGGTLVFYTAFHHMNDGGYYDGWTEHTVRVKPSLAWGFDLTISGRNLNDIKDYIAEVFDTWLREPVTY